MPIAESMDDKDFSHSSAGGAPYAKHHHRRYWPSNQGNINMNYSGDNVVVHVSDNLAMKDGRRRPASLTLPAPPRTANL